MKLGRLNLLRSFLLVVNKVSTKSDNGSNELLKK